MKHIEIETVVGEREFCVSLPLQVVQDYLAGDTPRLWVSALGSFMREDYALRGLVEAKTGLKIGSMTCEDGERIKSVRNMFIEELAYVTGIPRSEL